MTHGKNYLAKAKLVNPEKLHTPAEAIALLPETKRAKFDETVDLAVKLGVDTVKNPSIRGSVALPAGSGKAKKVAVICRADRAGDALAAGAVEAGADDLVEKIQKGFLGFDVLIASPDMMGMVGKLGKVLGPKGLMPNPKVGTVTDDIKKAVSEFRGGKVEFKMDKSGVVALGIGKISFTADALQQNFRAVIAALIHAKPSGVKGVYLQSVSLSTTMGPGLKVNPRVAQDEVS
ncbi:MAG: 50S ribosomal protein L1 [Candidatus Margulisiibacteriota bacterium]